MDRAPEVHYDRRVRGRSVNRGSDAGARETPRWAQANRVDVAELGRVTSAFEAGGLTLPGLAIEPFYEAGSFAWEAEAAARAEGLADELRALDGRLSTHPETDVLIIRGSWEAFFLWRGGSERPRARQRRPSRRQ